MDVTGIKWGALEESLRTYGETKRANLASLALEEPVVCEWNCTVDISEEGRRKWEAEGREDTMQQTDAAGEAGVQQTEKVVVLAADEEDEKPIEEQLADVLKFIDDLNHTYKSRPQKETDDERVEAMEELRQLMEDQEAAYQALEDKARELAVKKARTHSMVEKGSRDLVIMLESFRSREEIEESAKGKRAQTKGAKDSDRDAYGRAETLGGYAERVTDRAFRKELHMDETIENICGKSDDNLARVRAMEGELLNNLELVLDEMGDPERSDEEKLGAAKKYLADARPVMGAMEIAHDLALERQKTLRQIRLERLGNQNMVFASRTAEAIGQQKAKLAVDDAFRENTDRLQHERIEALEARIRELQGKKGPAPTDGTRDIEEAAELLESGADASGEKGQ